ncbi:SGNH/GDSL hydrolase family protein [Lentilactobacillus otakiensis]|uniref:G-D-S-L family lipolytic protein n=1 Tax=Lentilactobacillus otakiensis DSM 19908 = JCM 15040 TaxID=1423780 RepID=S4NQW7_9LACO|nr:SGNH/GDSL hydrolase family protein [Lentilactobacillus otakiensis]KRL10161.1 G-D-S-L family lipolytic protein [Lentilactobacillus otakiensis DSM 19908 = JCM 15040]MBZ3776516.1 SGNH/GDSL hydrolase family protein [Lentilactobacillus otakiensis]GAD16423.1 G-D-S-L family lipolytic protein [Lentilactobacillus otakiensis DSM 19908 = JCM 15040]
MNKRFYIATAITAALGVAALMTPAHAAATDPTTPTSTSSSSTKSKTSKDTTPKVIPAATIVSTEDYDQPLPYHMKSGYVYTTSGLNKTLGSAKNFAKITWYTYKKAVIDRSAQGKGNSVWYYVKSGSGKQSGWVWHGSLQDISEGTFNIAMKNSDYFKSDKIITMGDSITAGYDGYETLDAGYPTWLSRYLGTTVDNAAYNGAFLCDAGDMSTPGDLGTTVSDTNFAKYDVATIAYGTNDYGHTDSTIDQIKNTLDSNIKKMKAENKNLIIYGFLPITRYDNNQNSDDIVGQAGYTMNELRAAEAQVYEDNNVPYLNWADVDPDLITDANHIDRFNDGRLHPAAKTYQLMARDIAKFMIDNFPKDQIKKSTSTKKTTTKSTTATKKTTTKTSTNY